MTRLDDGQIRLRDGYSLWQADAPPPLTMADRPPCVAQAGVVIIGAGITGAFLAERFTREGRSVVVVDRHAPAMGSTAASTAMLLWELDASLLELEGRLGAEAAGEIANHCQRQVQSIGALVSALSIDCDFAFRPSLYLAGDKLDAADLREEHRLRAHLGIEGDYLTEGGLAALSFVGEGALLYPGSARVDPVKLARGLLGAAVARGAQVISPANAMVYETLPDGVRVVTQEGDVIRADALVLANGYEMPDFVPAARHRIVSSWALATGPGRAAASFDGLVWEASDPYLYMRSNGEGRVIVGGADEDDVGDDARRRLTADKTATILKALGERCPALARAEAEFTWSGAFGQTEDSLPFIGRVPGRSDCLAAYGYGGNGITFSALAGEMLACVLGGRDHPMSATCAMDRA